MNVRWICMALAGLGLLAGCGGEGPNGGTVAQTGGDSDIIGLYTDEAVIVTEDLNARMRGSGEAADIEQAQRALGMMSEAELYNPRARIDLDVRASGSYGAEDLLEQLDEAMADDGAIAMVFIQGTVADIIQAATPDEALELAYAYAIMLEMLNEAGIPVVMGEILPVVEAYEKRAFKMPATQVNEIIAQMNQELATLAMDQAQAFVYSSRVFGPRIGTGRHDLVINEANMGMKNGIQLTVEGMRQYGQLVASALHRTGYRGGRLVVLGGTTVSNEALPRQIDQFEFLLTKYLEIELNKRCD